MPDTFFLKPGYRQRDKAVSLDPPESAKGFWTPQRVETASVYQYHVYEHARDLAERFGLGSAMDVGCGYPAKFAELIAPVVKDATLVDQPSMADVIGAEFPRFGFAAADLERIDLDLGRKFDLILCVDVLEHLVNPDSCMRFIRNHLSPEGYAVLSTPERDHLRGRDCDHSPKPDHVREWNGAEFARYVASRGFSIVRQTFVSQLRLGRAEFALSRLLAPVLRTRRWSSCQMVVCRVEPGDGQVG